VVAHTDGGSTRYGLLETLRHYGRERLGESGDAEAARRAHAEHYVEFVEDAEPRLRGPQEARWVGAVTGELDELRAAQAWALEHDLDLALRLSAGLEWYTLYRLTSEVFQWAERAAAAAEAAGLTAHPSLPLVWASAAAGARIRGDAAGATSFDHRALATMEADDPRRRFALDGLADAAIYEGRLDDAFRFATEAAVHAERVGDSAREAYVTVTQAVARAYAGDTAAALAFVERARRLADASGSPTARGWVCYGAGETLLEKDPLRAMTLLEEALQFGRSVQDRFLIGVALVSVASVRGRQGEAADALRLFREVIEHWHLAGNWTHQWTTLRNVIDLFYRLGADEPAAVLYGAMTVSRTAPPAYGNDAERLADAVAGLPQRLGQARFADAVARGRAMADDDAVTFACAQIDRVGHTEGSSGA
jgi:tetratricopeptide (TPR) repeat protein